MTGKTYHTDPNRAVLDGWACAWMSANGTVMGHMPGNAGVIVRCYFRNPRRVSLMLYAIAGHRFNAEEAAPILGMATASQATWFLRELKQNLTIKKSPWKLDLIMDGRKAFWRMVERAIHDDTA